MSKRNNFGGGFILGAIFGSIVGGVVGTALASKQKNQTSIKSGTPEAKLSLEDAEHSEDTRRSLGANRLA